MGKKEAWWGGQEGVERRRKAKRNVDLEDASKEVSLLAC